MFGSTALQTYTRKIRFLVLLILSASCINNSWANSQKVYSVGIVPQHETHRLHAIWRPILDQLEKDTGLKFKLQGSPTIPTFEKEFLAGKFDFAYMNPYHLIWSHETIGYQPLIRDHSKKLHGVLVVHKDNPLAT